MDKHKIDPDQKKRKSIAEQIRYKYNWFSFY
jgi:hypothetical protein